MALDFDLTYFPATIDMLHGGLAVVVIVESVLLLALLTVVVIALLRKSGEPSRAAPQSAPKADAIVAKLLPESEKKPHKPQPVAPQPAVPPLQPVILKEATPDAALQLLGALQQEARFIDFIEEDIAAHSDADIGAVVRVVHEGCHKVLHEHFDLETVRNEAENTRLKVPAGFNPGEIRLTGNIVGEAPFSGMLIHRGWRVSDVRLPKIADGHDVSIIAPAEVEL